MNCDLLLTCAAVKMNSLKRTYRLNIDSFQNLITGGCALYSWLMSIQKNDVNSICENPPCFTHSHLAVGFHHQLLVRMFLRCSLSDFTCVTISWVVKAKREQQVKNLSVLLSPHSLWLQTVGGALNWSFSTSRCQTLWLTGSLVCRWIRARRSSEDGKWRPADGARRARRRASWRCVHLGGGAEPLQQEWPVAGDRSEGLQRHTVGQKAPRRV